MTNPPTVSVVIPTYKRPQKLSRAVKSVVNQTFSDWELIVVNDDPETAISHELPDSQQITCIQHSKNRGAPVARNRGILESEGEYIALLDDDDAWKPPKLECQVRKFQRLDESFGLVYTGRDIKYGSDTERYIPQAEGRILSTLLRKNVIPSETPLIKRECFGEVGLFDPRFESCQDLDLWIRLAKEYKISPIKESLAIAYRSHHDRISEDMDRKYQGHKLLIEKHSSSYESHPDALASQYRQLGLFCAQSGRPFEGLRYLSSTFRSNPRDLPVVLYLILCLTPNPIRRWAFDVRSKVTQ